MINDIMCLLCFLVSLKAEIIEQYQLYTTKFKDALFVASVIGYKDDSYSYRMIPCTCRFLIRKAREKRCHISYNAVVVANGALVFFRESGIFFKIM